MFVLARRGGAAGAILLWSAGRGGACAWGCLPFLLGLLRSALGRGGGAGLPSGAARASLASYAVVRLLLHVLHWLLAALRR